ncbi:MAG TPA: SDR family oxidoreductase [Dehalococcoidia bacterium]|nr:SDR family oxidoreductase [Dehalococcoidia bacterium]
MKDLRGSVALLTGASRGLGVYVARALAREGMDLVLAARSADRLEAVRRECEALGVRAISVPCDVTSRDDLHALVATAEREFGRIDVLVNNAGIEITAPLAEFSFDDIDNVIRTNLNAPIWLTKLVLPSMLARRRGVVVHMASMAGKSGVPYNSIYSATKHALIGLTESMNLELEGTGVRAGVVCPGFVADAGMWADHGGKAPALLREVSPEKVADAVLKVIRGSSEQLVTSGPVRPLLALGAMLPGMKTSMIRRMGLTSLMRGELEKMRAGQVAATQREPAETAGGGD